ncbi:MAG: hypothetical protein KME11_05105 [Timaviella obliquedivisa GSE-PSE-MK23-08B]|jgi:hypothetical protein|nr:hypothetical protein [Timaviella obliquedivisa GSE-PSE-MK23-08B]
MAQTRSNPINGNLEIWHDILEAWVSAVADLPSVGGKPVQLSSSDFAMMEAIANHAANLSIIQSILGNNFYPEIQQINSKLGDISTFKLQAIEGNIALLQTSIDYLSTQATAVAAGISSQTLILQSMRDTAIATSPAITNLTLVNANTQYAYTFQAGTKRYAFKCRADAAKNDPIADVRYSWFTGMVATGINSYDVLPASSEELSQDYFEDDKVIYFSSAIAGTVLTIREWQ